MLHFFQNNQIFRHRLFWVTAMVTLTTALFLIFYTPLDPLSSPLAYYPLGESGTLELAIENRLANQEGLSLSLRKLNGKLEWKCPLPGEAIDGFNSSQYPISTDEKFAWVLIESEEKTYSNNQNEQIGLPMLACVNLENGQQIGFPHEFLNSATGQPGEIGFSIPFIHSEKTLLIHSFFNGPKLGTGKRNSRFLAFSKENGGFLGNPGEGGFPFIYDSQFPSSNPAGWKLYEPEHLLTIAGENGTIAGMDAKSGKINFSIPLSPQSPTFLPEGIFACRVSKKQLLPVRINLQGEIDTLNWATAIFDSLTRKPVNKLKNQGKAGQYYLWTGERELSKNVRQTLLFWVDKEADELVKVDTLQTENFRFFFIPELWDSPNQYLLSDHFTGKERPLVLEKVHRKFPEIYPPEKVLAFLNPEETFLSLNGVSLQNIQIAFSPEGKYLISDQTSSFVLFNPKTQQIEGITDIISTRIDGVPILNKDKVWAPKENGYWIISFSDNDSGNSFSPPIVPDFYPKLVQVHFGMERFQFSPESGKVSH